jgi:hypothetical protein
MKKKFKDTKVGQWLKNNAPDLLDKADDFFPPLALITAAVKGKGLTPEQNAEFDKLAADHEQEMYALEIDDRKNARGMFTVDNGLQKIYAITFLGGYMLLTAGVGVMVYNMIAHALHMPDWAIAFVSTMWGGMSMKVSTINDFLFGSSFRSDNNHALPIRK